jgi:hypothetical protein
MRKPIRGCLFDAVAFIVGGIGVALFIRAIQVYSEWSISALFAYLPNTGHFFIDLLIAGCMAVASIWALHRVIKGIVRMIKWGRW